MAVRTDLEVKLSGVLDGTGDPVEFEPTTMEVCDTGIGLVTITQAVVDDEEGVETRETNSVQQFPLSCWPALRSLLDAQYAQATG